MDWFTKLLYLGCILLILILGAIALYLLFLIFGTQSDVDELENKQQKSPYKRRSSKCKHCLNKSLSLGANFSSDQEAKSLKQSLFDAEGKPILMVNPTTRQTMFSSLKQSAKDSDVILATALSSIPLKELGGSNNDIVVDVAQQIHFDKDELISENFKCIFCRSGGKISWNQVKCFAQTTIGVLVLKRTPIVDQKQAATDVLIPRDSADTPDTISKRQTVSNLSLAPTPDSRMAIKQQPQQQQQQQQLEESPLATPLDGAGKD